MGARFVRLGIAGFKSFAEATTLEILPGLTGIVGPNGCGKSNVAEAVRWAMGEGNARHLRGGEMDDVIFAGAAHRPSRNLAEVTLTLEDDAQGLLPPFAGLPEVQVSRRIERGSGSFYRVNGREARARDVQTLFADLASGARSSAMVSQGRVGQLVNARPDERRAVLEEAAGITGLHVRRSEAETRLRGAEANLDRAEERRVLLERQLGGLEAQAQEAARYRAVCEALLEGEALLLAIQRQRALRACEAAVAAAGSARAEVHQAAAAHAEAARVADALQAALPGLRETEAAARSRAERARMAVEGLAAEAARTRAAVAAAEQRQAQLLRDQTHAQAAVSDADVADARLVAESERLRVEADGHPAALAAAQAEAAAALAGLQHADEAAVAAAGAAATAAAEAEVGERLLREAETRALRAEASLQRAAGERERVRARVVDPARVEAARAALGAARAAVEAAGEALGEAERRRAGTGADAGAAREAHGRAETARHRLATECGALAEVLAVRDGERWPPMIDTVVVPAGLEAALGAVLGHELAAAEDPGASRHWRALGEMAAADIPGQRLGALASGPALLSRALGAIGLVGSEAEGLAAQATLAAGQSVVTADGGVWRWDGYTVRAGTPTQAAVRLRQRNRLAELTRGHEAAAAAAAAHQLRAGAEATERAALQREATARSARRDAETVAERARTALLTMENEAELAARQLSVFEAQVQDAAPEAAAAAAALQAARTGRRDRAALDGLRRAADGTRAAVMQARQREALAARALDALQRAEQARQGRIVAIVREREDRRMRVADLVGRVTDLGARAAEAEMDLRRLRALPAQAEAEDRVTRAALAEAEAAAGAASRRRAEAEQDGLTRAAEARLAEQATYGARERLVRAEASLEAGEQARTLAEARIIERAGALPALPEVREGSAAAEDRARARLGQLGREREAIGAVNLLAEAEAETIGAEVATIVREREALQTAIAKLRGSIGHLNREGRERLGAVFQQVDRHFQALFGKLFGGGRAHLALVGSEDPLQAGLEIYAQPPGKKLSALSLLSGGEQALTALSLVFAVFRCNPAPLCVLDEVDAPLDDANVGRFCALLSEMAAETGTRFLVVTHHQLTMAGMDRLYGVTMQERGVSRLVSVDLARAAVLVEALAAE